MENVNKPSDQHSADRKDNAQGSKEQKPAGQATTEQGSKGQQSGSQYPGDQHSKEQGSKGQQSGTQYPSDQRSNEQGSKGPQSGNFGGNQAKTEVKTPMGTTPNSPQGGAMKPQGGVTPTVKPVK